KDSLGSRSPGACAAGVSDASGRALLEVPPRRWSAEMLPALEVPEAWLPACAESPVASAAVSAAAAEATGLAAGTPVVGGGGDQAAQAGGRGVGREGVVSAAPGASRGLLPASARHRPAAAR